MGITIINVKEFEGKYLIFNRPSKKLSFRDKPTDDKDNLMVGVVQAGEVAGKSVETWLKKMGVVKSTKKKAVRRTNDDRAEGTERDA